MLLLHYNCPDPSCDVACRNWPALKAHVKTSHHRSLWYLFLTSNLVIYAHSTKKCLHTNISSTPPTNSPRILQPATPSKTSLSRDLQATRNANSVKSHSILMRNTRNICARNTNVVMFAIGSINIVVSPTFNHDISSTTKLWNDTSKRTISHVEHQNVSNRNSSCLKVRSISKLMWWKSIWVGHLKPNYAI